MEFFQNNQLTLIIIGVGLVLYAVFMVFYMKKRKASTEDFLSNYPNAAKIFLTKSAVAVSGAVAAHTVNGEAPAFFTEGGKSGFYVKPGSNVLEVSFSWSRPGVMYKTVTKSTGVVKQEVDAEAQSSYFLGYNKKENRFTFEEFAG